MSQENVEVVREMYDAFSRGDLSGALNYLDPDVTIDASHRVDGRVGHGRDEVPPILAEWLGTRQMMREEVEDIRDVGDRVLVVSTQRGRGKGSGIEMENRFGMLYEVRRGKVTRWTIYDEVSKALGAAGLSE